MSKQNFKKRLKIAMLGHKRVPSREGGIEVVVEELATRMVKMGHEVTCYNRKGHHVSGKQFDTKNRHFYKGIRLKKVFTIEKRGLAAMTSSFFAAIRTAFSSYDVVHFHAEVMPHLLRYCAKRRTRSRRSDSSHPSFRTTSYLYYLGR